MDEIRDTKKGQTISGFLQAVPRVRPFGSNVSGEKLYRRAEHLIAGLYLLTNHIHPDEPGRIRIRNRGAELPSLILDLRDELRSPNSRQFQKVLAVLRELISLVRILSVSGFVSPQNAGLMSEALDEFGTLLTASGRSTLSESVALSREELSGDGSARHRILSDVKDKRNIKDKTAGQPSPAKSESGSIGQRGDALMQVLKSGGQLGVKDISARFPEYSEKMIQRELAKLVAIGRVKKSGSKRWSRYALA